MKEKIKEILDKNINKKNAQSVIESELLALFVVNVNNLKLICEHQHGIETCGFLHKDVYNCKYLRNCDVCGN